MKPTLSFARLLKKLMAGEEVTAGLFKGAAKQMMLQFVNDGALDYRGVGVQRKVIFCNDVPNLQAYLHHKFEITSIDNFIEFMEGEDLHRSDAVRATGNSKFKRKLIFEGFLINGFESCMVNLDGVPVFASQRNGSILFIHDYKRLSIREDITVVVVENYENFISIDKQRYIFEGMKTLFIWRYQNSTSIVRWLNSIPNSYLHFGDFDPKGLHIYCSEFRNKIQQGRCSFLVPHNLELLMNNYGEKNLYDLQMDNLKNFDFSAYPEIAGVWEIIRRFKKGLAQEVLIE